MTHVRTETPSRFGNPQDRPSCRDRSMRLRETAFGVVACALLWGPMLAAAMGRARWHRRSVRLARAGRRR
jgi:hypothetical protein